MVQDRPITYRLVGLCKDFGFYAERNGKLLGAMSSQLIKYNKIAFC